MAVELRLTTVSWLPEVAIGAGILRFEREGFVERERERDFREEAERGVRVRKLKSRHFSTEKEDH